MRFVSCGFFDQLPFFPNLSIEGRYWGLGRQKGLAFLIMSVVPPAFMAGSALEGTVSRVISTFFFLSVMTAIFLVPFAELVAPEKRPSLFNRPYRSAPPNLETLFAADCTMNHIRPVVVLPGFWNLPVSPLAGGIELQKDLFKEMITFFPFSYPLPFFVFFPPLHFPPRQPLVSTQIGYRER